MAPLTARQVWRKYVTDGVPDSGIWDPKKEEIIAYLEQVLGGVSGIGEFRGPWDDEADYIQADFVESGGSLWYAVRANTNVTPVEGDDWTLLLPGVTAADGTITLAKLHSSIQSFLARIGVNDTAAARAIVILWTGQSNVGNYLAYNWTAPSNLYIWNGSANTPGSSFKSANDPTLVNYIQVSHAFAAEVARANPNKDVYVINMGRGSQTISQWMVDAPVSESATDMYAACKTNVESALALLGVTKIDYFGWWQGESDTDNLVGYADDWSTVWSRFAAETWFPRETPVAIMAVSHRTSDGLLRRMNDVLKTVVSFDPEFRTFVDTYRTASSLWDGAGLHVTGAGMALAGKMAYRAVFRGAGNTRATTPWVTRLKLLDEGKVSDTTLASDLDLQCYAFGRTSIRGAVYASARATGDFKWGFAGPAVTALQGHIKVIVGTTETIIEVDGSFPTAQVVDVSSTPTPITILFDMRLTPSAAGNVAFQWAQNVSNANSALVLAGSYIEIALTRT